MSNVLNLNFGQVDYARGNLDPLPAGWYLAVVKESEVVPTSKGDGFRLVLKYSIIDGPHKDRVIQAGYNIQNPNAKAVEIAMQELKTISACVGVFNTLQQSEQLHGIPLQIRLVAPKDSDYNEVKGYRTAQGDEPGKASAQQPPQQAYVQQPSQGFAQPAPVANQPYGPPPTQAPAWTPNAAPAYEQPAPASYGAPAQQPSYPPATGGPPPGFAQQPAPPQGPPSWAPPTAPQVQQAAPPQQQQQPQAPPSWAPNGAPPQQAPSWGQQQR